MEMVTLMPTLKNFSCFFLGMLFFVLAASLLQQVNAQAPTLYDRPNSYAKPFQIKPQAVPTTATDLVTTDVYIDTLTLTFDTASSTTCKITDKQGTPIPYVSDKQSFPAGAILILSGNVQRYMPGGITWQCSNAGVMAYLAGRY
jgi:hypothetical protein